jgi:hypothetical protein
MYLRLHLRILLDLRSSPTVLPLSLSRHVETGRAHHKKTKNKVATTKNPISVLYPSFMLVSLWWTRGESNSRPQRLHYEGITTIP